MTKTTHLYGRHRGNIPASQLALGTPADGDVPVYDDGSIAWAAGGTFLRGTTDPTGGGGLAAAIGTLYVRRYFTSATSNGPISFEGIAGSEGTGNAPLPSGWQVDDLAIAFHGRSAATPAEMSGWTTIVAHLTGNARIRASYRILQSGDTTGFAGQASSDTILIHIYRGYDADDLFGDTATASGSGTTITIPGLTLEKTDGTSWVVGSGWSGSTGLNGNALVGLTKRSAGLAGGRAVSGDSNGGLTSFTGATGTAGSAAWAGLALEIRSGPDPGTDNTAELWFKYGAEHTDWTQIAGPPP